MKRVEPEFEIDRNGRVLCKTHSNYSEFINPNLDYFEFNFLLNEKLTCKTCIYYQKDDCYFSRERIDAIEIEREKKRGYKCKLCGDRIDLMFTVIYKLYSKEFYDIEMPLICCKCYDHLINKDFFRDTKNRINATLFLFICTVFLFFNIFYLTQISFLFLLLYIPWFAWTQFFFRRYLFRLTYFLNGIKYYKNNFPEK